MPKLWLILSLSTTLMVSIVVPVWAQSPVPSAMNLTLSPVTLSLETDPGVPVTTQIKVRNNAAETEKLQVTIGSFTADETGERPILLDTPQDPNSLSWLQPATTQLEIEPGEWQTLDLTFSPPADAALNYFYAIYLSRTESKQTDNSTIIQGSPAVLVLSLVNSPYAQRSLELESFSLGQNWSEFLPQQFLIKVKNTGNVVAIPSGNVFIDGQGQKDLAVLSINPESHAVLPQSSRTFSITWDDGFPRQMSDDKTRTTPGLSAFGLEWDFSQADRFRFGAYTAHVLLVYDNGERDVPIETFATFWVIPWKLSLALLGVASFAAVGILTTGKKVWRLLRRASGS